MVRYHQLYQNNLVKYVRPFSIRFHLNEKLPEWQYLTSDKHTWQYLVDSRSVQIDNTVACVMHWCTATSVSRVNCNAFLDQVSFAMPFHQIAKSYLTVRQEGHSLQFIVKLKIYAYTLTLILHLISFTNLVQFW